MDTFSDEALRKDCPYCDPKSFALKYPLQETDQFWIVCDVHPLTKGHLLIIPKVHVSCIGEYPPELFEEYVYLSESYSHYLEKMFGSVSMFEHGKIGQTVFHSHVQMFPFEGVATDIVPEGPSHVTQLQHQEDLREIFREKGQYLYFSIGNSRWVADTSLGQPRFFRDRFARALGHPERGNWKEMHENEALMREAEKDIADTLREWGVYRYK